MFFKDVVPPRFERTVTATPEEFGRDLRKAWPEGVASVGPNRFSVACGDLALEIVAITQGTRRLGILELPLLKVTYEFHGGDEAARRRLLHTLDRAMQRGGG
ncbi:MAG TPA: hypothetical protein VJ673_16565 [Aromatoleum sp.]|uniref:hypothetical protein n=1 Tax=Aromatoleum sp. TaxID=2307007 RepID=UPI002B47E9F8|nr:hypothetical protein [Aromatoleum sp.]HJV27302.1 hypothetical protein [Aromatoleum sp.]